MTLDTHGLTWSIDEFNCDLLWVFSLVEASNMVGCNGVDDMNEPASFKVWLGFFHESSRLSNAKILP